jgi:hypothetical protein
VSVTVFTAGVPDGRSTTTIHAVDLVDSTEHTGAVTPAASMPPQHGLDDLYDIGRLADRLGVEHATIRVWLSRKVPWLPAPDGRLNGGAVWRASTLDGIETRRTPGRPGRKPRAAAAHLAEPAGKPVTRPTEVVRPYAGSA